MKKNASNKQPGYVPVDRRSFIITSATGIAATTLAASPFNLFLTQTNKVKAIAFDAFAIFDPRPVFALAESIFSDTGKALSKSWCTKQFEYSWLRTAANQYKDFWNITEDALIYAAKENGIVLSDQNKKELMEGYLKLSIWKDVLQALEKLKKSGIRLCFLSNMTENMLDSCIHHAELDNYFECAISTSNAKTYKPNPVAYQLGIDILKLKKEEILFTAFAGWDASGAKWFGYPTFWLNRLSAPNEELNETPDGLGESMNDLVNFIKQ
jgi:2-haloacid dehalogenase